MFPRVWKEIISKALAKDPDQRYQTANDLLVDLRNLKRTLNVDAENARTALFGSRMDSTIVGHVPSNSDHRSTSSAAQHAPDAVSSAEYIVNQVKTHKRAAMLMVVVLAALAGALSLFWYFNGKRAAPLTDRDTILLAEFENKTGEEVFDDTLRQGLAVQLQQSPFLDIFSDQRSPPRATRCDLIQKRRSGPVTWRSR